MEGGRPKRTAQAPGRTSGTNKGLYNNSSSSSSVSLCCPLIRQRGIKPIPHSIHMPPASSSQTSLERSSRGERPPGEIQAQPCGSSEALLGILCLLKPEGTLPSSHAHECPLGRKGPLPSSSQTPVQTPPFLPSMQDRKPPIFQKYQKAKGAIQPFSGSW